MSSAVLERVLAIPNYADLPQMGLTTREWAILKKTGKTKDGKAANPSVLKQDRSKTLIKGDRLLSDKEQKEARQLKKQEFRDRVGNLSYAPVGIAPTTKKALAMIDSMDEKELAKYESRTKGQVSRRYTVGVEKAKKRIEDLQDQINSLSTTVNNQNENLLKAQNVKANRAGRNAVKKRGKDNPHGLEADGIGAPHTKSAQKVKSLAKIYESSTQELQNLRSKQRSLMSVWGDNIAIKDRKDAQEGKTNIPKPSLSINIEGLSKRETKKKTGKLLRDIRSSKTIATIQGKGKGKRAYTRVMTEKTLLKKRAMSDRDISRNAVIASAKLESKGQGNLFNQPKSSPKAAIAPDTARKIKNIIQGKPSKRIKAGALPTHSKEPWMINKSQYISENVRSRTAYKSGYSEDLAKEDHKNFVESALKGGRRVSKEVLKDYPDLKRSGVKKRKSRTLPKEEMLRRRQSLYDKLVD